MLSVLETLTRDDEARYWSKVAKPYNEITECWMWTDRLDDGYGRLNVMATTKLKSHRIAWALHHNEDPPGVIDHTCGNKACVNPHHLEAVSHGENNRRARVYRPCVRGHHQRYRRSGARCDECYRLRRERIKQAAATLGITQTEYKRRYGWKEETLLRVLDSQ